MQNIRDPTPNDVICGRGKGDHPGNKRYLKWVEDCKVEYVNSSKKGKPLVLRSIVEAVRSQGGRFLQKDEHTGLWSDIGDQKARNKIAQALRHAARDIRKEIGQPSVNAIVPRESRIPFAPSSEQEYHSPPRMAIGSPVEDGDADDNISSLSKNLASVKFASATALKRPQSLGSGGAKRVVSAPVVGHSSASGGSGVLPPRAQTACYGKSDGGGKRGISVPSHMQFEVSAACGACGDYPHHGQPFHGYVPHTQYAQHQSQPKQPFSVAAAQWVAGGTATAPTGPLVTCPSAVASIATTMAGTGVTGTGVAVSDDVARRLLLSEWITDGKKVDGHKKPVPTMSSNNRAQTGNAGKSSSMYAQNLNKRQEESLLPEGQRPTIQEIKDALPYLMHRSWLANEFDQGGNAMAAAPPLPPLPPPPLFAQPTTSHPLKEEALLTGGCAPEKYHTDLVSVGELCLLWADHRRKNGQCPHHGTVLFDPRYDESGQFIAWVARSSLLVRSGVCLACARPPDSPHVPLEAILGAADVPVMTDHPKPTAQISQRLPKKRQPPPQQKQSQPEQKLPPPPQQQKQPQPQPQPQPRAHATEKGPGAHATEKGRGSLERKNSKAKEKKKRKREKSASPDADLVKVGSRISVLWPQDGVSYPATVTAIDGRGFSIRYDDGDVETLQLHEEEFDILPDSCKPDD